MAKTAKAKQLFKLDLSKVDSGLIWDVLKMTEQRYDELSQEVRKAYIEGKTKTESMNIILEKCNSLNEAAISMVTMGQILQQESVTIREILGIKENKDEEIIKTIGIVVITAVITTMVAALLI